MHTTFKVIRQSYQQDGLDQAIHYTEETVRACGVLCIILCMHV